MLPTKSKISLLNPLIKTLPWMITPKPSDNIIDR